MEAPASSPRRVHAGLSEVDLGSGEIHKSGRKVRLQEQPFRVLAMLLERPGELITRAELQARVWPADTFVGFDEGINTAIRKLRVAFGDSADNPRFIETIPRRGYRFVAPVQDAIAEPAQLSENIVITDAPADLARSRPRSIKRSVVALSAAALLVAGAIGSLGSKYVLELKAVNCQNGDTLGEEQVTASSKEKVLDALGEAASKLRGELGESLATVQRFDVPLYEATTSSLDAPKAYSLGRKAVNEKGSAAGLPYHQRASLIRISP